MSVYRLLALRYLLQRWDRAALIVASIALGVATPIGLGAAVFTAEFLPPRLRLGVKLVIELLAGVPSVVYGLLESDEPVRH